MRRPVALLPVVFWVAACSSTAAPPSSNPTKQSTPDAGAGGFTAACSQPNLGSPLLRALTRNEVDRTLADVFPEVKGQWTDSLPSNTVSKFGFDNDSAATIGNQQASAMLDTALAVATAVTGTVLPTLLPCAATSADRTCAEQFLTKYGRRLFRRPITTAEHDRYLSYFDSAKAATDFKTALKWMLAGLIQSPHTLYRREIGTDDGTGTRKLSPFEVATELAYTYTGSAPTDDLLTKAEKGTLGDPVAEAKVLLASDTQKESLQRFFDGYLGYTRVTSIQKPNISAFAAVSGDMINETRAFINDVVFRQNGGLKQLLTAPTTNPSKALAQYYGFPSPAADYDSVARTTGHGIGLLAQGSFLATHANADASSPTQRGLFPFSRLFCNEKPSPPPNVPPLTTVTVGQHTTRYRYEVLHAGPNSGSCHACHQLWDPIGFGFEHFDEGGNYRQTEGSLAIDSSADVPNSDGTPLFAFADEEGLVTGLAAQPVVYECFAGYLSTYAFGTGESCLGSSSVAAFQSGSMGIAAAFTALAGEPHFTQRSPQ